MSNTILYFDCFAGISGDMTLAALVDIGVPKELIISELSKLNIHAWRIDFTKDSRNGIGGTKADVIIEEHEHIHEHEHNENQHKHEHNHEHEHNESQHEHDNNGSQHEHEHEHEHSGNQHEHNHNKYSEIKKLINNSQLSESIKNISLSIFEKLAQAESKVHSVDINDIAFHEVGALDSIIDIVGSAIGIDYLKPDKIISSRVELGGGFVKCEHGIIPVPAPAVSYLLEGKLVKIGTVKYETTTPTGAAILASCADCFLDTVNLNIKKVAYGIGHRVIEIPNVLRLVLAEEVSTEIPLNNILDKHFLIGTEKVASKNGVVIECNIDDMLPEQHSYLFDKLFSVGADDVWLTPIVMKKSRSAITLSVLCSLEKAPEVSLQIIKETSTFGFRCYYVDKVALSRIEEIKQTSLGNVKLKTAYLAGNKIKQKVEYSDLCKIAEQEAKKADGLSLRNIREIVEFEIRSTN